MTKQEIAKVTMFLHSQGYRSNFLESALKDIMYVTSGEEIDIVVEKNSMVIKGKKGIVYEFNSNKT